MINQAYISGAIHFFRKDFLAHWRLEAYHNPKQPAIFLGAYKPVDIETINRHKGFKVVLLAGADMKNIDQIENSGDVVFRSDPLFEKDIRRRTSTPFRLKHANIPIKSFEQFKPCPLGDKVYCYVGKEHRLAHFRHSIIKEVEKESRFEFIYGMHPNPIEVMINDYYKQCFIGLRLNAFAGHTSSLELAHMGRRSVSNRPEEWYLKYKSVGDIVKLIEKESKLIGTTVPSRITPGYFVGEEWKDPQFWLT